MPDSTSPPPRRRSTSRSRRSHPSFSDLRLAPLTVPSPKQHIKPGQASPRSPGSIDPSISHAYRQNHSSYLAGRSNPSTPGILSRSSSKRRQSKQAREEEHGQHDAENVPPSYFTHAGLRPGPIDAASNYLDDRPKAVSETGLNRVNESLLQGKKHTQALSGPNRKINHKHRRSLHASGDAVRSRAGADQDDSWLSHATTYTTSLLAEGKGQAWVATHSSMTNLHGYVKSAGGGPTAFTTYHASDDDNSDDIAGSAVTIKPSQKQKFRRSAGPGMLHPSATAPGFLAGGDFDEPQRSPGFSAAQQGWGSRFGSRSNSVVHSRRPSRSHHDRSGISTPFAPSANGDRANLTRPSTGHGSIADSSVLDDDDDDPSSRPAFVDPAAQAEIAASFAAMRAQKAAQEVGYFDQTARQHDGAAEDEVEDHQANEEEIVRFARTPGAGPLAIFDKLLGMSNFAFDGEDVGRRVADETEDEHEAEERSSPRAMKQEEDKAEEQGNRKRRSMLPDLQAMFSRQVAADAATKEETPPAPAPAQQEGGGWNDAAWLLSVASKLLF